MANKKSIPFDILKIGRVSTHPGEILKEVLEESKLSQTSLAKKMGVPIQKLNTIINGKRGITAKTAILLSKYFKNSPQFWMNLQMYHDLTKEIMKIKRRKSG